MKSFALLPRKLTTNFQKSSLQLSFQKFQDAVHGRGHEDSNVDRDKNFARDHGGWKFYHGAQVLAQRGPNYVINYGILMNSASIVFQGNVCKEAQILILIMEYLCINASVVFQGRIVREGKGPKLRY